jgi:hypothetical protein
MGSSERAPRAKATEPRRRTSFHTDAGPKRARKTVAGRICRGTNTRVGATPTHTREPASPECLQATQHRADEALGRCAERGRQWDQLFDRHPALAVLAPLDGHQVPTKTFGQGFLRQAGALPHLVQRHGDGPMFGLELLGDAAGHAAMFKGRAPSQQNVVIAETVRVYSP